MQNLIHRVILRLTPEDFTQLKQTATDNGLTVSKYLRKLIQEAIYDDY